MHRRHIRERQFAPVHVMASSSVLFVTPSEASAPPHPRNPDILAIGFADGWVCLWNAAPQGQGSSINECAFDSQWVAVCSSCPCTTHTTIATVDCEFSMGSTVKLKSTPTTYATFICFIQLRARASLAVVARTSRRGAARLAHAC